MHHHNMTAELLYSTRTLVVNFWHSMYFISGRPPEFHSATMALGVTLFASICVLPHQLYSKRSTRCALVKTKNRSLLRHRGFDTQSSIHTEDVTFTT